MAATPTRPTAAILSAMMADMVKPDETLRLESPQAQAFLLGAQAYQDLLADAYAWRHRNRDTPKDSHALAQAAFGEATP